MRLGLYLGLTASFVAMLMAVPGCGPGEAGEAAKPVQVIAFDENEAVLEGIRQGVVFGTVVQNPYMYGYKSMEVLKALHAGKTEVIPADQFINIPARVVFRDASRGTFAGAEVVAVDPFQADLKKKLSGTAEAYTAPEGAPSFAFVTNGVASFWTIAKAGVDTAAADLGIDAITIMPNGSTDQTRRLEDLLTRGIDGIAISPITPENQQGVINKAAAQVPLVTHDSDAPNSDRRVYIGIDNYEAGLVCGKLVREALPDGGKVMIFIGRMDQDNSKGRRQGCIDAILGRDPDPTRSDPPGAELKSEDGKYHVLGTLTDNFDRAKAKANVEDTLSRHPDIAAMVGLFEYNPPLIMDVLDRVGRLPTPAKKDAAGE